MAKKSPRIFFRKRLKELRDYMEEMGKYTLEAYKDSIDVLFNYDEEKIATIMDINEKVDRMNYLLEQKTMSIIASEQPVARDLRFIEASIKVGSHFKRMTGLASNIAEVSKQIKDEKIPETPKKDIEHMADLVGSMVSKSITSFLNQDVETVRELHHDDDEVDDLFDTTLRDITESMFDEKDAIYYMVYLLFVARFLERIADRSESIGNRTVFMITCEQPI
ncbi:MAG: transcriptional regulator PhoU [Methanobacterium sp. PtaU1.Bin097]|jgi:phosphate transport system protein|nr:phosphate signaling complex protein PhoU [Methanobacteriaceae archaeon]OPY23992.1 MAG: transcriptional regulator PhoU [Methanobacterium sp. PtaU1.Bin097]